METLLKNKTKTTMETEKLTVKDAMLYPNAGLIGEGKAKTFGSSYPVRTIYKNVCKFIKGCNDNLIHKYKLILRPIESLTEEEIATIGTALGITHKMVMNYVTGLMNYNLDFMKATYVSDKCKEWNIDIYGFIKSGKAVAE